MLGELYEPGVRASALNELGKRFDEIENNIAMMESSKSKVSELEKKVFELGLELEMKGNVSLETIKSDIQQLQIDIEMR